MVQVKGLAWGWMCLPSPPMRPCPTSLRSCEETGGNQWKDSLLTVITVSAIKDLLCARHDAKQPSTCWVITFQEGPRRWQIHSFSS